MWFDLLFPLSPNSFPLDLLLSLLSSVLTRSSMVLPFFPFLHRLPLVVFLCLESFPLLLFGSLGLLWSPERESGGGPGTRTTWARGLRHR